MAYRSRVPAGRAKASEVSGRRRTRAIRGAGIGCTGLADGARLRANARPRERSARKSVGWDALSWRVADAPLWGWFVPFVFFRM
jgi:hypothetical protein